MVMDHCHLFIVLFPSLQAGHVTTGWTCDNLSISNMAFIAVAHVHEEGARKWWRFDDETVTVMPDGPIGEKADHGVAPNPVPSGRKVGMLCTASL